MHQSVHITELNDPLFIKALENLAAIQNMFECHFDKNDFDHWSPISHTTNVFHFASNGDGHNVI